MDKIGRGLKIGRCLLGFAALWLVSGSSGAEDVQVNTYTTGLQAHASVAVDDAGDFVVVWTSYGSAYDDSVGSVQAQRYTSDGNPAGSQFQVNTLTEHSQRRPSVAMAPEGDFVVVWDSLEFGAGVRGQRFAADGSFLGEEFQIQTYTGAYHRRPEIAMTSSGAFVVVWGSLGSVGDDHWTGSIQGRLFADDGSPIGSQFQVNTYTTDDQIVPSVAMNSAGDFVVVWESAGSIDSTRPRIHGQRYAADGAPVGEEFQVGSSADGVLRQYLPDVTLHDEGDFVVVWETDDDAVREVWAQRYASDGSPLAPEFLVSPGGATFFEPSVASSANGDFVIVLARTGASAFNIRAQRYTSDGSEIGAMFQVNTSTSGTHRDPSVTTTAAGEFLVAWNGWGAGGSDPAAAILRSDFFLLSDVIFADGFESGDINAWSHFEP